MTEVPNHATLAEIAREASSAIVAAEALASGQSGYYEAELISLKRAAVTLETEASAAP